MGNEPFKTKQALAITVDEFGNIISAEEKTVPAVQSKGNVSAPQKQTRRRRPPTKAAPTAALPLVKPKQSFPAKSGATQQVTTPVFSSLLVCPVCQVNVKATRLAKHLQNVHQIQASPTIPSPVKVGVVEPEILPEITTAKPTRFTRRNLMPNTRKAKHKRPASVPAEKVEVTVEVTIAKDGNYCCPFCAHRLSQKGLVLPHIADKHPHHNVTLVFAERGKPRREPASPRLGYGERPEIVSLPSHDALDGSKYIGQMRRENGRFGSFPLHDDYDE